MKRRSFVSAALGTGSLLITGCNQGTENPGRSAPAVITKKKYEWSMVTTWPKNFPGVGTAANRFAQVVQELSEGRLNIKVYGDREMVPAMQVFDTVSNGGAQMGHGAAYYWKGKHSATPFFTAVPFGMSAQEINSWLTHGEGLKLWKEVYAPFGILPLVGGNTGVQMAGWFRKEIHSMEDIKGLNMRIPGLGGEVIKMAGGTPFTLPGSEIYVSLETGTIDATEWIGPYNDLAFGLHQVAKNYYYPGWHEPGTTLETIVNQAAFDALPNDLKSVLKIASVAVNQETLNEFTYQNSKALQQLANEHSVNVRPLPDDVLSTLKGYASELLADMAHSDPATQKVYQSFNDFMKIVKPYHDVSELAYLRARNL